MEKDDQKKNTLSIRYRWASEIIEDIKSKGRAEKESPLKEWWKDQQRLRQRMKF